MPVLRVVILWHQHQPFYKDLLSGQYRLPWVRLHALKDYYGMVKLLDEFPNVHQTFNLVPSLITQIQDYVEGTARDPFLAIAAKPAAGLNPGERRFALRYLFQANPTNLVGRYPRYKELFDRWQSQADSDQAHSYFQTQDFTDLQVLSQIAWFDEFFLHEPEIAELIRKGRNYSLDDQQWVIAKQRELLAEVLPAHAEAAKRGSIELSTSPFYHPILPLICDSNVGGISTPGLALPRNRFRRPEDTRDQIARGLDLHEKTFGIRPRGMWPSEGSVSEEALAIAHSLGVNWMATDEGVLARTLGLSFGRDGAGRLPPAQASQLYTVYRYEDTNARMHLIFRDHTISDLIGFVYSGMPPQDAANHLMHNVQQAAQPVLAQGDDAVVSIILDGENAWEYFPQSGREFLRRFYDRLQNEPGVEAVTVSEAIERHQNFHPLNSLVPGSWINANFNVWIGAPEDNLAWDYLFEARQFFADHAPRALEAQRKLAYEELLIAEGSDWNWWYGPEHHSANDRDFDELYRKHLSNVYQALGAPPPDYLLQPIAGAALHPQFLPQTAYIHPGITGDLVRYFEWIGAAAYTADERSGAMHGKVFLLRAIYAGIDETNVYGRLDFTAPVSLISGQIVVSLESQGRQSSEPAKTFRLDSGFQSGAVESWSLFATGREDPLTDSSTSQSGVRVALQRNFEFKVPLATLGATMGSKIRLRFSLWQNGLPADSLPAESWLELPVVDETEMLALGP
jgi:alpha-amylase/alpha-mannosidase (GH57 family)